MVLERIERKLSQADEKKEAKRVISGLYPQVNDRLRGAPLDENSSTRKLSGTVTINEKPIQITLAGEYGFFTAPRQYNNFSSIKINFAHTNEEYRLKPSSVTKGEFDVWHLPENARSSYLVTGLEEVLYLKHRIIDPVLNPRKLTTSQNLL